MLAPGIFRVINKWVLYTVKDAKSAKQSSKNGNTDDTD